VLYWGHLLYGLRKFQLHNMVYTFEIVIVQQNGNSALIRASWEGNTEIVEMLLGHSGINVNLQDEVKLYIVGAMCTLNLTHFHFR